MTLNDLLSLNGTAFLQSAYLLILQRDADPNGQSHYSAMMLAGGRKYEVISDLAKSGEARRAGATLPGMDKYLARQRWADMPVIGWFVHRFYNVESKDPISRQVRALQMQLAVGGLGEGTGGGHRPASIVAGHSSGQTDPSHGFATHLALDVTRRDDLSPETIAIYALLKSPA
jgi:hypothetical protein